MGLTHGTYETEVASSPSPATWRPSKKSPSRYVKIKATQQKEALKLCEVQVKVPRQPCKNVVTDKCIIN
ncbi:hypothetical protein DPMN_032109 [Dreissena polymorpha]|uniref:Uncharacterized protein n=1 Tax=Dreissena polymorpha TaxID=45954 RepID=A0A9D4M3C3_DREPO|nr:hypothetical protein DPMN_032109 [Dreissena polymorpha]